MDNITFITISRQKVLQEQLDVVANNVANVNTQGFKAENIRFRDYLVKIRGSNINENLTYADNIGKLRNLADGPLQNTGNDLDVAISGPGYFQVRTPQGIQYTRSGRFQLNNLGVLVDSRGQQVLSADGAPINLAGQNRLVIATDGTISNEAGENIGRVGLVNFNDEINMVRTEQNQYTTNEPPIPVANPIIIQGSVELSNVSPVMEITKLIKLQNDHVLLHQLMNEESGRQNKILETYSGRS